MAIVKITATKTSFNAPSVMPTAVNVDAAAGAAIYPGADHKTLLLITRAAAGDATVKAGNGIQGVRDLVIHFDAAGTQCVTLESGAFVQVSGDNKGAYVVTGAGTSVAAVILP